MYNRRSPSTNPSYTTKSMAFLHKPQRVSQSKPIYPEDSVKRNTDLNRGSISIDNDSSDYFSTPPPQPMSQAGDYEASLYEVASPLRVNPYFPANLDSDQTSLSDESTNGPPSLVRKKSGEIVRSNLKTNQRSRSLPATPSGREPDKRLGIPLWRPKRSKSVHFDQRDVVSFKYFRQEDSPLDVAAEDVLEGPLDDKNCKPLSVSDISDENRNDSDSGEPLDLTMTMSNLQLEKKALAGFGLRRSRRYQKLKSNGAANGINGNSTISQPGFYFENFAILNVGDRTSLKLNIFLNIAHSSNCFLQELSLVSEQHYLVGHILVKNIFFDKKVVVKYTRDRWRTANEVECVWVSSGDDVLPGKNMDRFKMVIDLATVYNGAKRDSITSSTPSKVVLAESVANDFATLRLEFCIQYMTRNVEQRLESWDNNGGRNYIVEVVAPKPRMGFTDPFRGV
ncbi:LAME_0A01992g1_1 [Lachancea meyersii CBS 8951]|uniref:LAME_0A01992g1_1 n=1 Tax=Lachancea meyersii CBS 8951 TaxID=1266667 RepID=A0A1G4IMN6_9SACH|nr:LAME_0A01992g1_1 [Lachancea meyersii CBS 8951]